MSTRIVSGGAVSEPESTEERTLAVRELENVFGTLANQIRRMIQESAERVSPGMLPGAYKVFTHIARCGPSTPSALAESLMVDKGHMSRMLRELGELGLTQRTTDPHDGRSSLISVTAEGEERLRVAREPHEGRLTGVLADWPVDNIRQLTVLLDALSSGESPGGQPGR